MCTEEVHAVIVAKTPEDARQIAEELGDGVQPDWPTVDRYNIASRSSEQYNLLDVEEVSDE